MHIHTLKYTYPHSNAWKQLPQYWSACVDVLFVYASGYVWIRMCVCFGVFVGLGLYEYLWWIVCLVYVCVCKLVCMCTLGCVCIALVCMLMCWFFFLGACS